MTSALDNLMEDASQALVAMDYRRTELLCTEALAAARQRNDWAYYARILLPLQEARRQMRMTAAEGDVRLGTSELSTEPSAWLGDRKAACVVVTHPHNAKHAGALLAPSPSNDGRSVDVLFADCSPAEDRWCVRSVIIDNKGHATASKIRAEIKAPPEAWRNRWLGASAATGPNGMTPADWFLDAGEALGDAALLHVTAKPGTMEYIDALEACLRVAPSHEIIHQTLAQGAMAMLR